MTHCMEISWSWLLIKIQNTPFVCGEFISQQITERFIHVVASKNIKIGVHEYPGMSGSPIAPCFVSVVIDDRPPTTFTSCTDAHTAAKTDIFPIAVAFFSTEIKINENLGTGALKCISHYLFQRIRPPIYMVVTSN